MKNALVLGLLALPVLVSCGGSKKPAQDAENAGDDTNSGGAATQDMPATDATPDGGGGSGSGGVAAGDDKPATPCTGFDVDLSKVLSQASCEIPNPGPGDKQRETKGILDVKLSAYPKVAPGGHLDITISFQNKSKVDLPLDFVVDPEPRFEVQIYDKNGRRVDAPSGNEPSLPAEVASAPVPEKHTARATVVQAGTAHITLGWDAVKMKWAPKEKAKGAVPGRGYPTVPAGPLPKGKYTLRVVTPLIGVFEGVDHEVSQPRVPLEIAP